MPKTVTQAKKTRFYEIERGVPREISEAAWGSAWRGEPKTSVDLIDSLLMDLDDLPARG